MMADSTVSLNELDRIVIAEEVARQILESLPNLLQGKAPRMALQEGTAPGIQVLSPGQVADQMEVSKRHLQRLESAGELPRRRRISDRRVGYFAHEVDGVPAEEVVVRDMRTIDRERLAEKLSLAGKTIERMAARLPRPSEDGGVWFERDIDAWLLKLPLA